MTPLGTLTALGCALALTALLSSCALVPGSKNIEKKSANRERSQSSAARGFPKGRINQVDYGPNARFVLCHSESCPRPTKKTLPEAIPSATAQLVSANRGSSNAAVPITAGANTGAPSLSDPVLIHFPSGSSRLADEARQRLDSLIAHASGAKRIELHGRTDGVGPEATNHRVARLRALAVRDYLAPRFPAGTPIRVEAKGACCYLANNDSAQGRAINRRVEVRLELAPARLASVTTTE